MDLMELKRQLLSHYEREHEELGVMITRLRRELGIGDAAIIKPTIEAPNGSGTTPTASVTELVKPGDFFGMTQVQAVRAYLERTSRTPASLQDIAGALHRGKATDRLIEGPAALRNLSSVLSRSDDFVSVAKGRWGLSEWYPAGKVRRARRTRDEQEREDVTATDEAGTDELVV